MTIYSSMSDDMMRGCQRTEYADCRRASVRVCTYESPIMATRRCLRSRGKSKTFTMWSLSLVVVVAFALLGQGCVSYHAVAATAKVGAALPEHQPSVLGAPDMCFERVALGLSELAACEEVEEESRQWARALQMLGAYATALDGVAGVDGPDADENIAATFQSVADQGWLSLPDGAPAELGSAMNALVSLITNGMRQRQLKESVPLADRHVQAVSRLFHEHVSAQLGLLENVEEAAGGRLSRDPAAPPVGTDQRVYLMHRLDAAVLLQRSLARRRLLQAADARVRAFAVAHARLTANIARLGTDDLALLEEVLSDVQEIYEGIGAIGDSDADSNSNGEQEGDS